MEVATNFPFKIKKITKQSLSNRKSFSLIMILSLWFRRKTSANLPIKSKIV